VPLPDVFSALEIARAARVPRSRVAGLIASGRIPTVDGRFVAQGQAVRAVRMLRSGESIERDAPAGSSAGLSASRRLFERPPALRRHAGAPLAVSGGLHAVGLVLIAFFTTLGISGQVTERLDSAPARLVFLAQPGPGGGGGGGGLRQPAPPPKARLAGREALKSPVSLVRPVRKSQPKPVRATPPPPLPKPAARPAEPPQTVERAEPVPTVVAPVVSAPADDRDRPGVLAESPAEPPSHGPGSGGGVGSGSGSGIGEGDGSGIGRGTGGGTGGGPYRPGTGITPPGLLREVKPEYSEEARRRGVEGDVVVEIVVRADGGVGSVRLLQGLGSGLDQRAMDAVRQWRFSPAKRYGVPVDVVVEVAVEFKLR
jgi:TonB family protein